MKGRLLPPNSSTMQLRSGIYGAPFRVRFALFERPDVYRVMNMGMMR